MKTIRCELHKSNIHGRVAGAKPQIKVTIRSVNDSVTTTEPEHQTTG
jgi:hypothetical protein